MQSAILTNVRSSRLLSPGLCSSCQRVRADHTWGFRLAEHSRSQHSGSENSFLRRQSAHMRQPLVSSRSLDHGQLFPRSFLGKTFGGSGGHVSRGKMVVMMSAGGKWNSDNLSFERLEMEVPTEQRPVSGLFQILAHGWRAVSIRV